MVSYMVGYHCSIIYARVNNKGGNVKNVVKIQNGESGKQKMGKKKLNLGKWDRCIHCGADTSGNLENLKKIQFCINCQVDIGQKGQWTGSGYKSLLAMVDKHGKEAVLNRVKKWR